MLNPGSPRERAFARETLPSSFQLEGGVPRDRLEVAVVVEERCAVMDRGDRDEAVDLVPQRVAGSSARAVNVRGLFEVGETLEPQDWQAHQLRPDACERLDRGRSRECLHQNNFGDRDVRTT